MAARTASRQFGQFASGGLLLHAALCPASLLDTAAPTAAMGPTTKAQQSLRSFPSQNGTQLTLPRTHGDPQ